MQVTRVLLIQGRDEFVGIPLGARQERHLELDAEQVAGLSAQWHAFYQQHRVLPQRRIFFSGDTGYDAHFSEVGRLYGPFDWVVLDPGQYNSRWANIL